MRNETSHQSLRRSGRFARQMLEAVANPTKEDLQNSALIFAPHPDDETLGCGGTILRKRATGADVGIVFMTDGRTSHRKLIPEERLVALRASEAVAASRALNITEDAVSLLNFPDGQLDQHRTDARRSVAALLKKREPQEVYIPCREEPPRDHWVTREIVLEAIREEGIETIVLEYPIWFWYHWPWVPMMPGAKDQRRTILKNTINQRFGLRFRQAFNYAVSIESVQEQKRAALEKHATQMSKVDDINQWLTLEDVADGKWLACFFQGVELFRRYKSTDS